MSDYSELKRLATAANAVTGDVSVDISISSERGPNQPEIDSVTAFVGAATPAAVLALIAENQDLRKDAERYRLIRDRSQMGDVRISVEARNMRTGLGVILDGIHSDHLIDSRIKKADQL